MAYLFPPPPVVALPVFGLDDLFPVHRVYCVGQNYGEHAREMGDDPAKTPPFFFQKNPDSLVLSGEVPYPTQTRNLHHEVELVAALSGGGRDLSVDAAASMVFAYAIGLDLTRRDLQNEAKQAGRPWELAKAFDHSAPIAPLHRAAETGTLDRGRIFLSVDGQTRQDGDLADLIWKVPEIVSHLSRYFELKAGDVIFTGTPAGVGPVARGQTMRAAIDRLGTLEVRVV